MTSPSRRPWAPCSTWCATSTGGSPSARCRPRMPQRAAAALRDLDRVLGVMEADEAADGDAPAAEVEALLEERIAARAARDWARSDALRDELTRWASWSRTPVTGNDGNGWSRPMARPDEPRPEASGHRTATGRRDRPPPAWPPAAGDRRPPGGPGGRPRPAAPVARRRRGSRPPARRAPASTGSGPYRPGRPDRGPRYRPARDRPGGTGYDGLARPAAGLRPVDAPPPGAAAGPGTARRPAAAGGSRPVRARTRTSARAPNRVRRPTVPDLAPATACRICASAQAWPRWSGAGRSARGHGGRDPAARRRGSGRATRRRRLAAGPRREPGAAGADRR